MAVAQVDVGLCNAVRRTLISDLRAWAPHQLTVRANTSTLNDELLAHRIGLIPFRRVGNGSTMTVAATGPCTVLAGQLLGPAFEAVHPAIEVVHLAADQSIDVTVHFDERTGADHARYATCAAVGMRERDDGAFDLHLESVHGTPVRELLLSALDRLDARVGNALHALAHQPTQPPHTMC